MALSTIRTSYLGAGRWFVSQDGRELGEIRQGITQAWTARNAEGAPLLVKGYEEFGGSESAFEVAQLVRWFE